MDRRKFISAMMGASLCSCAGLEKMGLKRPSNHETEGAMLKRTTLEKRVLGRTGQEVSVIVFGGIVVKDETPENAARYVAEAVDHGVNYFDVAPSYGDAEVKLGPALKPYRDQAFLACKTTKRGAARAEEEFNQSLKNLQTDHFDLYQLHALVKMEDVEKAFAPKGVMEFLLKAREAGKVRYLGFSAHDENVALAALERFDFDTIMFPFSYGPWLDESKFGQRVLKVAGERKMGLISIKSMAHRPWPEGSTPETRRYKKTWYEPLDDREKASLALRFALNLPVHVAIPPGEYSMFKMALEIALNDSLKPLQSDELDVLKNLAQADKPVFPQEA